MAEKKIAVLMGNTEFPETNGELPPLPSSRNDVVQLQSVLTNSEHGWFTHTLPLIDLPHYKVMRSINQVFREATRDDEVLIYYSGHGQLDSGGSLHFATINTDLSLLHATSLPAEALAPMLRETRCRRICIVLDCCYSAGIARIMPDFEEPFHRSVESLRTSISEGYAVSTIAASSAIAQAHDSGEESLGLLTEHIINGIQSGDADSNDDGLISMAELFEYVEKNMPSTQKPACFNSGPACSLIVARSKAGQISSDVIAGLKWKLQTALQTGEITRFIHDNGLRILDKDVDEIKNRHESIFGLLTAWMRDKVSTNDFIEQWHQVNGTGLPEAALSTPSTEIKDRWEVVRKCRKPIVDLLNPTYLLDKNFQFLDWNPMFDELIAKPLALMRGRHVEDFILKLENKHEVIKRARSVFEQDNYPIVDLEILVLKTKYGLVRFQKIASQIADEDGGTMAWAVNLNVLEAEDNQQMWCELGERLKKEVNWSLYAKSYDRMLLNFDSYQALVKNMVSEVGGDRTAVLDLAAGTGNITMEMLRQSSNSTIWALEANEDMLEYMREKIRKSEDAKYKQVNIVKGDLLLSLREFDDESFDGAIMMNALYAMEDRSRCLREIFRVLKPDGVLVYSSSTTETDVKRLFTAIRNNLSQKGCLEAMHSVVDSAYDRHIEMMESILKDTHEEVVDYAKHAGFTVEDAGVIRGAYEGAVTVVKAVKSVYVPVPPDGHILIPDQKVRVFISYAHKDSEWCERVKNYLKPLTRDDEIEVWTDDALEVGERWRQTISEQLERTTVAILLISTHFLNSDFITNNELPALLHSAKSKGLLIVPVILEQCLYDKVTYKYPDPESGPEEFNLAELQGACSPTQTMDALDKPEQNVVLDAIAERIVSLKQNAENMN